LLAVIFGIIFIGSLFANQDEIMKISLLDKYAIPMKEGFWLGSDSGGRSILGQLILGARNSIIIGFTITILTSFLGTFFGMISGYYGGIIDNIIKMGEIIPATAVKTYYTAADNMEKIVLRAFENMSQDEILTPCVNNMGEPQQTDPAHNVKLLGELEMLLPPNTKKGSPIEVTFQIDVVGVYVKAINLSTGEIVETTLRMESDVDAETSAVNQIGISAE